VPRGTLALLTLVFGAALAPLPLVAQTPPPPQITKAFGAATIPLNGTTSLTFTLSNPNATTLTALQVSDTFPAGLVIATPNGLVNPCAAGFTATAGTSSLSFAVATLAASASCTFSVNVVGTQAGVLSNTVSASSGTTVVTSNASITVVAPPSTTKTFGASTIPINGTTSLRFAITNPNATTALTGVGFNDALPAGLVISTPSGLSGNCSGTVTAVSGSTSISFAGVIVPAGATCGFTVANIVGVSAGVKNNVTGAVTSTNGGTGNTAAASLTVLAPPTISKAFGAASILLGGTTSLSFTITNPNATAALTGVAFTDPLPNGTGIPPGGLVVASPNGLTGSCGGGTITAVAASGSVSLSGATIAASGSCTFSVNVTGTVAGLAENTMQVTSTNGGAGNFALASVKVIAPPTISKAFGVPTIPLNGTTSLTFHVFNPNPNQTLTGIGFSDTLPAGLVVSTPNGLTVFNCTGATVTATAGSGSVSLSGVSLPETEPCNITINVTGTAAGVKNNITSAITSTEGGSGGTASASVTVVAPPTISKAFGAASIPVGGTTPLTFTITNPNTTVALTGVGASDALPAGLVISTPSGLSGTCSGTVTAVSGSSSISIAGATVPAGGTCGFTITSIVGQSAGVKNNTTGAVTSTNGGTGTTSNTASLVVAAAPTISKAFGATQIALGGTTSLSFTINNPNASTLTGVGFSDALPSGLTVASPNGLTGSCGGGTITAVANSTSVSLGGATLAASSSCTFSVNVRGIVGGVQNNVTSAVTSTEGGTGGTAAATVNVLAPSIPVPLLSGWSLVLLVLAFVAIGLRLHYRRARTR
jgi:uncharacterized repeat protein (TIGR01451 family)